jgi:hypothetical protein
MGATLNDSMIRHRLTDGQWVRIEQLLPGSPAILDAPATTSAVRRCCHLVSANGIALARSPAVLRQVEQGMETLSSLGQGGDMGTYLGGNWQTIPISNRSSSMEPSSGRTNMPPAEKGD